MTKTVFITGANKSIGFETARQLGKLGYQIFLGARNEQRGQVAVQELESEGIEATWIQIDVAEPTSVQSAITELTSLTNSLDVLVNNAGISGGLTVKPTEVTLDIMHATFATNLFGAFDVFTKALPLLQTSEQLRVVNVSSGLGSNARASDPKDGSYAANSVQYRASKAALNMMTIEFAKAFANTSLKINAAHPGFTATDFNNHSGGQTVQQAAEPIVRLATLPADGPTGTFQDISGVIAW